jgi:hypothetical protein
MGSIAQAVSTSGVTAPNSPDTAAGNVTQAIANRPDGLAHASQDTVDLTETGSRNVPLNFPGAKASAAFQVTYFPPSEARNAEGHPANQAKAEDIAVAQTAPVAGSSPQAQAVNAGAQTTLKRSFTGNSGTPSTPNAKQPTPAPLSPASQAKLEQLNQLLQRLGINPNQISFAARIALLPMVNDPAAIQQFVQGLPTQTAVLNPATAEATAAPAVGQQVASSPSLAAKAAVAAQGNSTSPRSAEITSAAGTQAAGTSISVQIGASGSISSAPTAEPSPSHLQVRNGQTVNISV